MFTKKETVNFLNSLVKNVQRETQKSFALADVVEEFSKASDSGTTYYGIRYYFSGGKGAIRFNYSKSDNYDNVRSIDVWTRPNSQPDYTVVVDEDTNLVQAVDQVKRIVVGLKTEVVKRADADIPSPVQEKIDRYFVSGDRSAEEVDKLFVHLEQLVKSVANRSITSVLCLGSAGAGKCVGPDTQLEIFEDEF